MTGQSAAERRWDRELAAMCASASVEAMLRGMEGVEITADHMVVPDDRFQRPAEPELAPDPVLAGWLGGFSFRP